MNKIPYAINNSGYLVSVDEVENGIECNCFCPDPNCRTPLIAKNNGIKKNHHFAHVSESNCHAGETILHLLSKEILLNSKIIKIPKSFYSGIEFSGLSELVYNDVKSEIIIGDIRPDIVLYDNNDIVCIIEIKVTHGIDELKKNKIRDLNLNCIEIDVSFLKNDLEDLYINLETVLVEDVQYKTWINNKKIKNFLLGNEILKYKKWKENSFGESGFFDVKYNIEIFPNSQLGLNNTLLDIWEYNNQKPFVVINFTQSIEIGYYIKNFDEENIFGYRCDVYGDDHLLYFGDDVNAFAYKPFVRCWNDNLFLTNLTSKMFDCDWAYIQDVPNEFSDKDLLIQQKFNENKIAIKKLTGDLPKISDLKSIEYIIKYFSTEENFITCYSIIDLKKVYILQGKIESIEDSMFLSSNMFIIGKIQNSIEKIFDYKFKYLGINPFIDIYRLKELWRENNNEPMIVYIFSSTDGGQNDYFFVNRKIDSNIFECYRCNFIDGKIIINRNEVVKRSPYNDCYFVQGTRFFVEKYRNILCDYFSKV